MSTVPESPTWSVRVKRESSPRLAAVPLPAAPVPTDTSPVSIWLWTTLAALLGWMLTTAWLLWRLQPRREPVEAQRHDPGEAKLFGEFAKACEQGLAAEARAALLRWGQAYFDDTAPPTIGQLRARFASEDAGRALDELERGLYAAASADWSGDALLSAVGHWRKNDDRWKRRRPPPLPPLYKSSSGTSGAAGVGV